MSFILNSDFDDRSTSYVKISDTLIDNLYFGFMNKAGKIDIISKYLTVNDEVISYRQKLFDDILKNCELRSFMEDLLEKVEPLVRLKEMSRQMQISGDNEMLFSSFRELLLFTECIDFILEGEKNLHEKTTSVGIRLLFDRALEIAGEEWYQNAKLYIDKTCEEIKEIQSVTLGINLDAQLGVSEVGLISINPQRFTTNTLLDKMFAKKITDKNYICIEAVGARELKNAGVSLQIVNSALYHAMSETVGKTIRKIKSSLYDELARNTCFLLGIYEDLQFISICMYYILSMQGAGMPLCIPKISENDKILGLYNPNLVGSMDSVKIVKNNASFDEQGKIFIVTGANSGGKSVYLRSVGIAQVLFQLGLPVPAKKAEMQICHEIFSHFSAKAGDRSGGRFENECKSVLKFYKEITENSLVLLDEMFSTTGAYEGTIIATRILKHFAKVGCKCVYTTHMHELTSKIDEINSEDNVKSKIDGLATQMINEEYTYKINRCRESYSSYAEEVCKKYGLDF